MHSTPFGRPRTACTRCKELKIRCSADRPVCRRCIRLNQECCYAANNTSSKKSLRTKPRQIPQTDVLPVTSESFLLNRCETAANTDSSYLGIPKALVFELIEVYFRDVYNAHLLLHKQTFVEAVETGNANVHNILSLCAWAANFYEDEDGQNPLKAQGFMTEWASRAGKLVFQEAERLEEENIVTHLHLCLFWFSQGSWRLALIHKVNACALADMLRSGMDTTQQGDSLNFELRRRRIWACYLTRCHLPYEILPGRQPNPMKSLRLPWSDDEFAVQHTHHQTTLLENDDNGPSKYGAIIEILSLWSRVHHCISSRVKNDSLLLTDICSLDEELSDWWEKLPPEWKLSPSDISRIPPLALAKTLLINIVYHQCHCALHASVVPLFSGVAAKGSYSLAVRMSAQLAYEHALMISDLIAATLATETPLSSLAQYIAYAAYCSSAILIPFLHCSNGRIRARATACIKGNTKLIMGLAKYWKLIELLKVYLGCLIKIHETKGIPIEAEPKNLSMRTLNSLFIDSEYARTSILGYCEILTTQGSGWIEPGQEREELGIEHSHSPDELGQTASELFALDNETSEAMPTETPAPAISVDGQHMLSGEHEFFNFGTQSLQDDTFDLLLPFHNSDIMDAFSGAPSFWNPMSSLG